MKWMKDPLAGFISRCGARMGKFTALLVTIAMLAGTTGAGATAFADETVTDGGNVAAESAASQPESTPILALLPKLCGEYNHTGRSFLVVLRLAIIGFFDL